MCGAKTITKGSLTTAAGVAGSRLFIHFQSHEKKVGVHQMAESQHCEDERQALLDKDAPSMAKYNSRVGRARMANQNARNQAHASHSRASSHTADSQYRPARAAVNHSST